GDAGAFTIDSSTGVVSINASADYETKSSYSFNVVASDGTLSTSKAVTVAVSDIAPTVTSSTSVTVPEGVATSAVVYTATATDPAGGAATFSLAGTDAGAFTIDPATGEVTFNASPDYETKSSYSFTVNASDPSGAFNTQAVTVTVSNVAPAISSATTVAVAEGTGTGTTVYTAAATDAGGGTVTYSLAGADAGAFSINASTGAVKFSTSPDFETKSSYSISVKASDASGAFNTQAVTVTVTDVAPVISSGATGGVTEGAAAGTTVYTAAASDAAGGTVTYSLSGTDAGAFSINASTGVVTINAQPDFDTQPSYSINVIASDGTLSSTRAVTISVGNSAPVISSGTAG